jgi:hypothetical protein
MARDRVDSNQIDRALEISGDDVTGTEHAYEQAPSVYPKETRVMGRAQCRFATILSFRLNEKLTADWPPA